MEGNLKYWLNGVPVLIDGGLETMKYWKQGEAYIMLGGLDHTQTSSDSIVISSILKKTIIGLQVENVGLTETSSQITILERTQTDTFSLSENIIIQLQLVITDIVTIIESVITSMSIMLSHIITLIESFVLLPITTLLESLYIVDDISSESEVHATRSDTLLFSEQLSNSTNILQSDAYAIVDVLSSFIYIEQSNDDTVNFIESLILDIELSKIEILELIDSYAKIAEYQRILSNIISVDENLSIDICHLDSDMFNFVEYIIQTRGIAISDIFDVTETEKIDTSKKLLASVLFTEQLQQQVGFSREDAFGIVDTLLTTSACYKDVIESINIIESISKENSLTKTETIALIDTFFKASGYVKTFAENPIFSETLQKNITVRPVDFLNFVDFVKFTRAFHLLDTFSLTELILLSTSLSTLDTLNMSDDLTRQFVKQSSDFIELLDIQARIFAATRIFTDSLVLDETTSFAEQHLLVDMLTIQEIISTSCNISKSDILVIIGEVSKTDTSKNISDEFVTLDNLTKSVSLYIIDTEETIDLFSKLNTFNLSQDDIVIIADSIKVDRRERLRKNKTTLISSTNHNKVYLFHKMRN